MPWRLIMYIAVFAVLLVFITFNLNNKCDLSLGFVTFRDVPVFLTVFISFILGLLCTMPIIVKAGIRKKGSVFLSRKPGKANEKPASTSHSADTGSSQESNTGDIPVNETKKQDSK